jgi:hypothetical protein
MGVALDMDAGTLTFYKNNTSQGTAFTGLSGAFVPAFSGDASGTSLVFVVNFGQRPFAYTAPSGFKALCTQNLPTPTIGATTATQASKFFAPTLYTQAAGANTITTGLDMSTYGGLIWEKPRNVAVSNFLTDTVRGLTKYLVSDTTAAEGTSAFYITSVTSTGYTNAANTWTTGTSMVSWNWITNGTGSTNTSGSITSTVSANTTSGFSVVTYTGTGTAATIGHGLGVAPSMLIFKSRSNGAENWNVYHKSIGTSNNILLNTTGAMFNDTAFINNTAPTSTVLSVGGAGSTGTNQGSGTYVCYAFAEVAGYSKFGSFVGNGSSDGVFVYTGFRPAFVLIKQSSGGGGHWSLKDSARSPSNVALANLFPNLSNAETSEYDYDILSNGFKLRTTSITVNASGETYIYACFAQNPFKTSLAR